MFCFVEDNKIIFDIEKQLQKSTYFQHTSGC